MVEHLLSNKELFLNSPEVIFLNSPKATILRLKQYSFIKSLKDTVYKTKDPVFIGLYEELLEVTLHNYVNNHDVKPTEDLFQQAISIDRPTRNSRKKVFRVSIKLRKYTTFVQPKAWK
jgi:hypothetical protein